MRDDAGAGYVLAEFRSIGNGVVHGTDAALDDQVDDELHLMNALEVCVLGLIACLDQNLEAAAHQVDDAAAQDSLLAEQVGFGLFVHGGFHDARTGAADTGDVCQGDVPAVAGCVLLECDQAGNALACHVLGTDGMAGALGGSHEQVDAFGNLDQLVTDVEAMSEGNGVTGLQVGENALAEHGGNDLVVDQDHDDVGGLGCLFDGHDRKAGCFGSSDVLGTCTQADDNIDAGVLQVHCMGMALGAITDDGDLLAVQGCEIAVILIVHFCHSRIRLSLSWLP